jgi:hypothetical protein
MNQLILNDYDLLVKQLKVVCKTMQDARCIYIVCVITYCGGLVCL